MASTERRLGRILRAATPLILAGGGLLGGASLTACSEVYEKAPVTSSETSKPEESAPAPSSTSKTELPTPSLSTPKIPRPKLTTMQPPDGNSESDIRAEINKRMIDAFLKKKSGEFNKVFKSLEGADKKGVRSSEEVIYEQEDQGVKMVRTRAIEIQLRTGPVPMSGRKKEGLNTYRVEIVSVNNSWEGTLFRPYGLTMDMEDGTKDQMGTSFYMSINKAGNDYILSRGDFPQKRTHANMSTEAVNRLLWLAGARFDTVLGVASAKSTNVPLYMKEMPANTPLSR